MEKQRIAVPGATGRLGRHVVDVLEERGHDVVRISRSNGVDVITGDGLAEALAGVDVIVDAATGPSPVYERGERVLQDLRPQPAGGRRPRGRRSG